MEDCRSSPVVRALLEATPDGILVTDASGRIVVTNERFREVVGGVGPTPTVGEPIVEWLRRLGTPLANEWSGIESRTLAGDPVHEMGFSLDLPEDSTRVLTVSTALVDRPDGEPCVLSVWQDLTAHTRAKEDLARSERFNRSMVESSPLGIIVLDGEGRLTYENPAVRRLLGVPEGMESPALGMRLQDVMPIREGGLVPLVMKAYAGHRVAGETVRYTSLFGKTLDLEVHAAPLMSDLGEFDGAVIMLADVTSRHEVEQTLRRLRSAIEQTAEMITITDLEGNVLFVNPAFEKITGFSRDGKQGLSFGRVFRELALDALPDEIRKTVNDGRTFQKRIHGHRSDGSRFDIDGSVSPVRDDEGEIVNYVGIGRDVTREVELESRLREAQKMEAIGTLAGGIAHDFNNIVHVILGFAEVTLRRMPREDPSRGNIEEIVTAAKRGRDLVDRILTFSRRSDPHRIRLDLGNLVRETLGLLRGSLPATIEFDVRIEPCDPVLADPGQMNQVILNLAANAFRAMRDAGGVLQVQLTQRQAGDPDTPRSAVMPSGRHVELRIRDTGHGMDDATLERIFEPYFSNWETGDGTGFGLSLVHGIVSEHGGRILVDSAPGEGTLFTILLPATTGSSEREDAEEEYTPPEGVTLDARVMFVDDESSNVELGRIVLERLGCTVVTFTSSTDALEAFLASPDDWDAVFSDQTMPRLTGIDLSRRIRDVRKDLPIAVATGFSETLTEKVAREAGIDVLLRKPLRVGMLEQIAIRMLGGGS